MATSPFALSAPTFPTGGGNAVTSEPIEGNSLTQFLRSLDNHLAQSGQQQVQFGQNLTQAGVGGVSQAANAINPTVAYWTKLLSGDPNAASQALAPEASQLQAGVRQQQQGLANLSARGGGRSGMMAQLPFQQQAQLNNLYAGLRPQAAQGLTTAAATQGSLADAITKAGLGQTGIGSGTLGQVSQNKLNMRGQDVTEHGQAMGMAGQLAGQVVGGLF